MTVLVLDSDDYASHADDAGYDIAASTDLLIQTWVKSTTSQAAFAYIGGKIDHYYINHEGTGYPRCRLEHSVYGTITLDATAALTLNSYDVITVSYDFSAGIAGMFINTARVAQVTGINTSGGITDVGGNQFTIGSSASNSFVGSVGPFLVSTNITGYDPSSSTITVPTVAPTADGSTIVLYQNDDGTGTTITDDGGSALNLTFAASTADPSWDTGDSPFSAVAGTSNLLLLGVG